MKKWVQLGALVCAKLVLISCSLVLEGQKTRASFTWPRPVGEHRPLAPFACLNVWGADGRWNSSVKSMSKNTRGYSVEFEVPYLWVGKSYNFRVVGFDTDPSAGDSSYRCPISDSVTQVSDLGVLNNKLITQDTTEITIEAYPGLGATDSCGVTTSCYDPDFIAGHTNATLKDGTKIELVDAVPVFKVWKKKEESKILKAHGKWAGNQDWQRELLPNGTGDSTVYFSHRELIQGRTCPKTVYRNAEHKAEQGECLYFTEPQDAQALNADSSGNGTIAVDKLENWNDQLTVRRPKKTDTDGSFAAYYEGNIKTCRDFGMRLPTLYEFIAAEAIGTQSLPDEQDIEWDTTINGLYFWGKSLWTATAYNGTTNNLFFYVLGSNSGSGTPVNQYFSDVSSFITPQVICVLP